MKWEDEVGREREMERENNNNFLMVSLCRLQGGYWKGQTIRSG